MDIYDLAKHLPDGVHWGDEITPMILDEIVTPLLESASRADQRAREDVIQLLENMPLKAHEEVDTLLRAIKIIRSTITEDRDEPKRGF